MYTRIRSNKLYEQIAEQIKQRILRGELRTGDRLPTENKLAEQFGASRTAIREAMKTLAQQGLIDTRPGRGAIVINDTAPATPQHLQLLMKVRGEARCLLGAINNHNSPPRERIPQPQPRHAR